MRKECDVKYFKNREEITAFLETIKLIPCPYCKMSNTLIRHSFLIGQRTDPNDPAKPKRGQRIYCSKRNNHQGCGRTFDVVLADSIKGFTILTSVMWAFFASLIESTTVTKALIKSKVDICITTAYRWKNIFTNAQSTIRTALTRRCEPEQCASANPLEQTYLHLKQSFPDETCPLSAFQLTFQKAFI